MKSVGKVRKTLKLEDVYPGEDDYGERNMTFDFDGDGEDENVTFYRGQSHADGYGSYMTILFVKWADGREIGQQDDYIVSATIFRFLEHQTNGMPDIIADNQLMKWNGSNYESQE